MEVENTKTEAKMQLVQMSRDLMPAGKPSFLNVIKYPKISQMAVEHGSSKMIKVIFLMVKDFCNSVNVVRNMNESQMIEAASMLLDECGNFRLEDYTMMFSMAKRGDLVKILDRIDISVISSMMDEYWSRRKSEGKKAQESSVERFESLGNTATTRDSLNHFETKLLDAGNGLASAFEQLRSNMVEHLKPEN